MMNETEDVLFLRLMPDSVGVRRNSDSLRSPLEVWYGTIRVPYRIIILHLPVPLVSVPLVYAEW
eukprot:scaffold12369_cov121-Amphora_coffeaeformis.AAC.1